jgi:hypothetical protein
VFYNYIDTPQRCIYISDDLDEALKIRWNTLSTSGPVPTIQIIGDITNDGQINRNWISGGNYCISQNTSSGTITIDNNRFGRTSTAGLFTKAAGTHIWYDNRYEDDESVANQGDTAPL